MTDERKNKARSGRDAVSGTNRRLFNIKGHVQGVWFRESTRREAIAMGLTGYAKNLPDGSVEVLACGEPRALDRLHNWLRRGPPMARVEHVECSTAAVDCPSGFMTL
ncbi:MAG: acylphosphatase [Lysobacterales bacterium]|jgi:acylphosphatase